MERVPNPGVEGGSRRRTIVGGPWYHGAEVGPCPRVRNATTRTCAIRLHHLCNWRSAICPSCSVRSRQPLPSPSSFGRPRELESTANTRTTSAGNLCRERLEGLQDHGQAVGSGRYDQSP